MSTNPLNDISRVYLEQVATEEFVDPEHGEAPSGRSPLQNVSDHPNPRVRKKAVGAFKKQMGKEYGGTWKSRSKDPVDEAAKPDYLDFDKDGNEKESMKKALKDKAKKKNLEEAGGRQGGGTIRPPKPQSGSPTPPTSTDRAAVRFGKKPVQEAKKPNDGNLANNYPPYDKVTRGDVIAGATGKDQMGGKKKAVKEGYSNWREDLREVMSKVEKDDNDVKITEKKVDNKIKTSAMGGGITLPEAVENLGGTLLEMEEIDEAKQAFPFKKVEAQKEKARKDSVYGKDTGNSPVPQVSDAEKKATTRFSKMQHAHEKAKREKQEADKERRSPTFYKDTHPTSAPKMKKANEEYQLDEKITAKTDMGAAIKDFYASKSPQLAGRSKEERRKAAIAAVLTARRGERKRVEEQAMELQPKTQQKTTSTSSDNIKAIAAAQKAKQAAIALKTKELATLRQTPAGTAVSTFG